MVCGCYAYHRYINGIYQRKQRNACKVAATVVVALIVSRTSRGRGQVVAAPARVTGVREIAGGRGVVRLVDFELVDGRRLALVATAGLAGQVVVGQRYGALRQVCARQVLPH